MSQVITDIRPGWAVPGGRVALSGQELPLPPEGPPHVAVGGTTALVVSASSQRVRFVVPTELTGGTTPVRVDGLHGETAYLEVASTIASDVHHVDSPLFDGRGRLYVTNSGSRGERPVTPLLRFDRDGTRTSLAVEVGNPTSLALGPDGLTYISSRFDGQVYRLLPDDTPELFATGLGVATGLAFDPAGNLFVGDRSGTVFRVTPSRAIEEFASLPASTAAYHLAFGPDEKLYVSVPTLGSHDALYRIGPDREVETVTKWFGRPQGLAFDETGELYVVDALAGAAGLFRLDPQEPETPPEQVLAAPALVGVAFDPSGGVALASNEAVWRLDVPITPLRF